MPSGSLFNTDPQIGHRGFGLRFMASPSDLSVLHPATANIQLRCHSQYLKTWQPLRNHIGGIGELSRALA
jgi:hypothetical protein